MFMDYLKSENKKIDLLTEYADRLGNGAAFKRLGFLLEQFAQDEQDTINLSQTRLTKGNSKLDPKLPTDKLVTRWRLWIPKNWSKER
jgi:predicted transcriptional regulator of viral defense system